MLVSVVFLSFFFFFNDTAPPEIYTLSLHDALPLAPNTDPKSTYEMPRARREGGYMSPARSEEHTSELQSRLHLIRPLLLEKKKNFFQARAQGRKQHTDQSGQEPRGGT